MGLLTKRHHPVSSMSRCDCEGVFYRVFCVSLLLIAFTFTVILTNVFVDIDNLLSRREREYTEKLEAVVHSTDVYEATTEVPDYIIGAEPNEDGNYRGKRSLNTEDFFLRINSQKSKSSLTNRLATLLESLDDDANENSTPNNDGKIYLKTVNQKNNIEINEVAPENEMTHIVKADEDILHMAVHNALRELDHDNLQQLVDKLNGVVNGFKRGNRPKERFYYESKKERSTANKEHHVLKDIGQNHVRDDDINFNFAAEIGSANDLKQNEHHSAKKKNPKFLLQTWIDIKNEGKPNSKEDIKGIVKVIYDGQPVKIIVDDNYEATTAQTTTTPTTTTVNTINRDVEELASILRDKFKKRDLPKDYFKTITMAYLKRFEQTKTTTIENKKVRIKRNLDSSENEDSQTKDDDELFVEIETHFDKTGLEGEKKRQLVTSLIKKIQNAIRSSPENNQVGTNKLRNSKLRKRAQNPLNTETMLDRIYLTPISKLYRDQDPIGKDVPITYHVPLVTYEKGDGWKSQSVKPKFLSAKSINSAELNQVAVDYDKQSFKKPLISKRTQLPLTTDTSEETNYLKEVGDLRLLLKDIEGTGFSIGYNQYMGEEPDPNSIKLFHGIEHLIDTYHQKLDNPDQVDNHAGDYVMYGQEIKKREVKRYESPTRKKRFVENILNRKSLNKVNDYHMNGYKLTYSDNYRYYKAYNEEHATSKRSTKVEKDSSFAKKDKPSQINIHRKKRSSNVKRIMNTKKQIMFNKYLNTNKFPKDSRTMFVRHKRQVDEIDKTRNSETAAENYNMFIVSDGDTDNLVVRRREVPDLYFIEVVKPTKEDPFVKNKVLFQPIGHPFASLPIGKNNPNIAIPLNDFSISQVNKDRNKRQLHTIRIIDRDTQGQLFTEYTDGSRHTQLAEPQVVPDQNDQSYIQYTPNNNGPLIFENNFSTLFDNTKHQLNGYPYYRPWEQFNEKSLVSNYPHVFIEKADRKSDHQIENTSEERQQVQQLRAMYAKSESEESQESFDYDVVQDLVKAVVPSGNNNLKVTLKIIPRESNETKEGIKRVHTSIHESFNKNGLLYSSQVNVTKISKVELANKTKSNTVNNFDNHLKSTTPNTVQTIKSTQASKEQEKHTMSLTHHSKKIQNAHMKVTDSTPRETTTESKIDINLLDIILPSSPRKIYHLTVTDIGKLIHHALTAHENKTSTTQNPHEIQTSASTTTMNTIQTTSTMTPKTTTTVTTTMTPTITTTTTVTLPTTTTTTTTVKPDMHSTYPTTTTIDPLKIRLLKAMSMNEKLTGLILERIDQNTGVLKTFLTKISSEIAKLPDIANQAIIENTKQNPDLSDVDTTTKTTSTMHAVPVTPVFQKQLQVKQVATHYQSSNQNENRRIDVGKSEEPKIVDREDKVLELKEQTKYFIDSNMNNNSNTSLPQKVTHVDNRDDTRKYEWKHKVAANIRRKRQWNYPPGIYTHTTTSTTTEKPIQVTRPPRYWREFEPNYGVIFRIHKYILYTIERELKKMRLIENTDQKREFFEDYLKNHFSCKEKPEVLRALTAGAKLVLKSIFGLDFEDSQTSNLYIKPQRINY